MDWLIDRAILGVGLWSSSYLSSWWMKRLLGSGSSGANIKCWGWTSPPTEREPDHDDGNFLFWWTSIIRHMMINAGDGYVHKNNIRPASTRCPRRTSWTTGVPISRVVTILPLKIFTVVLFKRRLWISLRERLALRKTLKIPVLTDGWPKILIAMVRNGQNHRHRIIVIKNKHRHRIAIKKLPLSKSKARP